MAWSQRLGTPARAAGICAQTHNERSLAMSVFYGTSEEKYLSDEAQHEEAKEEMRDYREHFVRAYLMAVEQRLLELQSTVQAAIARLGYSGDARVSDFSSDAATALPTLDELLHGDRVGEFTGRELHKLGIFDGDAISEVASELMGKVFKV